MKRRLTALFGAALLLLTMSSCSIFRSEYSKYDVTGYLNALLKSSYQGDSTDYMEITGQTLTKASENQKLTVENGAVYFCNLYKINPSDAQMAEINELVKKAYGMAKYTVDKQQETPEGYTVNIEITPLTMFADYLPEAEELRKNAKELLGGQAANKTSDEKITDEDTDLDADSEEDEDSTNDDESETTTVNLTEPFIERVIADCREKLNAAPAYGTPQTISMKIIRTEKGELQLDTTQLEQIDRLAVQFEAE